LETSRLDLFYRLPAYRGKNRKNPHFSPLDRPLSVLSGKASLLVIYAMKRVIKSDGRATAGYHFEDAPRVGIAKIHYSAR